MSTIWARLIMLAYGSVALATLLALFADMFWGFELFSHFRVQYLTLQLVLLALLASLRRWLGVVVLVPLLAVNLIPLSPYLTPATEASEPAATIVLASINLNSHNDQVDQLLAVLAAETPDIVVLQEFTPQWAEWLTALQARYRHRVLAPRSGNFGIALLSIYPLVKERIVELTGQDDPAILATLQVGGRQLTLFGVHTMPPLSGQWAAQRNRQLAVLGGLVAAANSPIVVLGDLNSTPWSPFFQRLLEAAPLRDAANGGGLEFTWPTFMPLLGIPIDHCLVSHDLSVVAQHQGSTIGSDHYPLFTTVAF